MRRQSHLARAAQLAAPILLLTAANSTAQLAQPRLAIPAPISGRHASRAVSYAIAGEKHASILLAQVVAVTPLPGAPPDNPAHAAHPRSEYEIPEVQSARFVVLRTLCGRPDLSPLSLQVENPPPPHLTNSGIGISPQYRGYGLTRHMRVGELWLLAWDPVTRKVDQSWSSGFSRLDGADDPSLALYALWRSWMDDPNPEHAEAGMAATALESRLPPDTRWLAFASIGVRVNRRQLPSDPDPVQQHLIAALLRTQDTPDTLRLNAFSMIRPDVRTEVAPGSDEAYLLRYVIHVLDTSTDPKWLAAAATAAYVANMGFAAPSGGKSVVVIYPDLIAALQRRADQEAQQDTRFDGAPATLQIGNVAGHHRLSAQDAQSDSQGRVLAVERQIPPG